MAHGRGDYFHEKVTLKREEFEVTDRSEPPKPSIWYTQCGSQTAVTQCMIIASNATEVSAKAEKNENRLVVARKPSQTREVNNATAQARKYWRSTGRKDDLPGVHLDMPKILDMIRGDPKKSVKEERQNIILAKPNGSKKEYMDMIDTHLGKCKEDEAALIWYAGHGTSQGDWLFEDGVITFEDILGLYGKYFFNRLLYIVTDCCYSGTWVTKLAEKLDEMGVKACGHQAKRLGCFLKIFASCYHDQEAVDTWYVHAGVKPANDGTMRFPSVWKKCEESHKIVQHEKPLPPQDPMALDTTSMRCFHDTSSDCFLNKMEPCHQWKWIDLVKRATSLFSRIKVFSTGRHWYYVILHSSQTDNKMCEGNLHKYGYILAEGDGLEPPDDVVSRVCSYSPLKNVCENADGTFDQLSWS